MIKFIFAASCFSIGLLFAPINFAKPIITDYANIYIHNEDCDIISEAGVQIRGVNASIKSYGISALTPYPCNSAILNKFIPVDATPSFNLPIRYKERFIGNSTVYKICVYEISSSSFLSEFIYTNDNTVQRYTIKKDSIGCKITK